MTDLKPCPFCGGKAALRMFWMGDGHRYRAVECFECGATTPGNYSEAGDQSAWDWNARTPEQAIAATLGRGTCEWVLADKWSNENGDDHVYGYTTGCGHRHTWWPDSLPNYCPSCGRAVDA